MFSGVPRRVLTYSRKLNPIDFEGFITPIQKDNSSNVDFQVFPALGNNNNNNHHNNNNRASQSEKGKSGSNYNYDSSLVNASNNSISPFYHLNDDNSHGSNHSNSTVNDNVVQPKKATQLTSNSNTVLSSRLSKTPVSVRSIYDYNQQFVPTKPPESTFLTLNKSEIPTIENETLAIEVEVSSTNEVGEDKENFTAQPDEPKPKRLQNDSVSDSLNVPPLTVAKSVENFGKVVSSSEARIQNKFGIHLAKKSQHEEAFQCFLRASEAGSKMADFNLGLCYLNGLGVESNLESAIEYFVAASEKGHKKAMYNLGILYSDYTLPIANISKAIFYFKKAAMKGDVRSINCLDLILESEQLTSLNRASSRSNLDVNSLSVNSQNNTILKPLAL